MTRPRPVVGMSLCLGDAPVRYDGAAIRDPFAARLAPFVDVRPVCPEVEIGLGVPRAPIRIEGGRLVQASTGRDLTEAMRAFAARWLGGLGEVDGFLLKSRSPSCGVTDVKRGGGAKGAGLFAEAVLEAHPEAAVEDEGRLTNARIREHWLTRIFASAELRQVRRMGDLVRFHARHKLLLMACRETSLRALGRLVANPAKRRPAELLAAYRRGFAAALAERPAAGPHANVLEHALGYFKDALTPAEKRHFLAGLRSFRAGRLPLSVPVALLRAWLVRHPRPYLEDQAYLFPFPEELADLGDSGKGRGL
jgi:uncharacterized protein YbgA (DUF1722 family)/uncharacterized protein YbbK (DUF523 family)